LAILALSTFWACSALTTACGEASVCTRALATAVPDIDAVLISKALKAAASPTSPSR